MARPDPGSLNRDNIVAFIADIFERRGAEAYLGEAVTMSAHMLQAALQAEQAEAGDALIAAALLHDIGHFTSEFPADAQDQGIDNRHDAAGAAVLESFFPEAVTACVRGHVAAKRYLCRQEPAYFDGLSSASVLTLELQGGAMSEADAAAFEANPQRDAIIQVRRWDDAAKDPTIVTPPFSHYAPLLQRVVDRHLGER